MRRVLLAFLVSLAAATVVGQAAPGAATALDSLGAIVKDGHLDVEADLRQGSVPAIPKYTLEVQGSPRTKITADAANGAVTRLHFSVENGKLVVRGKGLRPKVSIESLDFESPRGIHGLKFQGLGLLTQ